MHRIPKGVAYRTAEGVAYRPLDAKNGAVIHRPRRSLGRRQTLSMVIASLSSWNSATTSRIHFGRVTLLGSVLAYSTSGGRRYRVVYRKPDHSQGQKRGFRTKRDAELYLAEVEVSKARGEFIDASSARARVEGL